jgi:excinuclease ABC subunit B
MSWPRSSRRCSGPLLVIAHNKTLAAQLYSEFKEFFPHNAVEYFVSYYDYYQPEAYIPRTDTYIEKDAQINDEIERLRLAATSALFSRRDVIIVASVSCIYGLGDPEEYGKVVITLRRGEMIGRERVLRHLVDIFYERNDAVLAPGKFRVRGDTLEVMPAYGQTAYRIEFWGDEVERILEVDALTGEVLLRHEAIEIYPAKHFITPQEKLAVALEQINAGAGGATDQVPPGGETPGGPAPGTAHPLRYGDAPRGGLLLRHRELFAAPLLAPARRAALDAPGLFPSGLPHVH